MGAERGKNAHTQMRQGWLLGDWIEDLELLRSRAICRSLRSSRKESSRML